MTLVSCKVRRADMNSGTMTRRHRGIRLPANSSCHTRDKINDRKECGSCEFTLDKICNASPSHLYGVHALPLSLSFSLFLSLSFPENITPSPEFSRKYAYWKSPSTHTSNIRPFHFSQRIDTSASGRLAQNRKI